MFRIPFIDNDPSQPQSWDEGVGYDFVDLVYVFSTIDRNFSDSPSNWFQTTTISGWSTNGIYQNDNSGTGTSINYSALTIVDTQHFELGDENIAFDMTDEINQILKHIIYVYIDYKT